MNVSTGNTSMVLRTAVLRTAAAFQYCDTHATGPMDRKGIIVFPRLSDPDYKGEIGLQLSCGAGRNISMTQEIL